MIFVHELILTCAYLHVGGWHHEQHEEVLILFNTVVMPLPCLFAKESGEICQWILKASFLCLVLK